MAINDLSLDLITMTELVNNLKLPAGFLRDTFYSRETLLPTESVEIGRYKRGRQTAPFVVPGATALIVGKRDRFIERFTTPNIRIKCSINPGDFAFEREPGETNFGASGSRLNSMLSRRVSESLQDLEYDVLNTEEWMCSQAIQGSLSYSVIGQDSFTMDYGRNQADFDYALTGANVWSDPAAFPEGDISDARKLASDCEGVGITDMILGSEAAAAFLKNESVQRRLDGLNFETGSLDVTSGWAREGSVRPLGRFGGLNVWEYCRSVNVNGTPVEMIRPKYAEFLSRGRDADRLMYYGAIADDLDAIRSSGNTMGSMVLGPGGAISKRFSKSWQTQDPTSLWVMLQSRPMPMNRRPDSNVSIQVVA